ncbi:hypothetical protein TH53_20835 [Pedobacter lusitanus]|uniref:Uncharacterized protein n=1 Tax=Pedobacter lusitanus TaxID=1503925 RepID=A0A0D0GLZ3_9SPHI|nr:hypothetical protein [Pedobacter lusitanus]KIO75421.1 hypothetical protein TH53_20835 [Pedobacter lusitanus]
MARPDRRPSEMMLNYQYAKNSPVREVDKPYFQYQYSEVTELLKQKIMNFIMLNSKLRENISSRHRFIEVTPQAVIFNLIEFSTVYRKRFIDDDFENYCEMFIELIKPVMISFLKEVQFYGFGFHYHFRLPGKSFDKIKTEMIGHTEG